jgi:glycosyltransferase involved in cell wall biosynthesis
MRLGADHQRVTVVPCGVDLTRFRPEGPAAARSAGRSRVLVVSRLVPRKGIDDVVRSLALLPESELVVAGGSDAADGADPEAGRLRAIAQEAGVGHRVLLLGPVARADVPALMRSADVVCCTPWYEPFGMVALEAMATGIPVVATAVGGLVDTVVHGRTGLHVRPRDPAGIAAAVGQLLTDPERRRGMGAAAVERAAAYSWGRVAEATAELYTQVIASHRTTSADGSRRRATGDLA